jgi:H+/Cl- antiporter ClcA
MTDAEIMTTWALLLLAMALGLAGWLISRVVERMDREERERWRRERVIGSVYQLGRMPEHDEKGGE